MTESCMIRKLLVELDCEEWIVGWVKILVATGPCKMVSEASRVFTGAISSPFFTGSSMEDGRFLTETDSTAKNGQGQRMQFEPPATDSTLWTIITKTETEVNKYGNI